MQVWRQEGIITTRGLTLAQRVSYLATMLAYFEGWQRADLFPRAGRRADHGHHADPGTRRASSWCASCPYYILTFWVFEEVARGYGRTLLTEQYNMMRFAVFITATFGFFLRKLRFVVTPKTMGEADATRRVLWPQYLVLGTNVLAIPIGLFYLRDGARTADRCARCKRDLGFADLRYRRLMPSAMRCALPVRAVANTASRCPSRCACIAITAWRRLPSPPTSRRWAVALSGCRRARRRKARRLRGELLLPTGPLPVVAGASVR